MDTTARIALERLKVTGLRLTAARRAIVEVLARARAPLSAAETISALAKRRVAADRATVYRELESLVAAGAASPVRFESRAARYELTGGAHHHHAVCVKCGAVQDVPAGPELESAERRIARRAGFKVLRHSFELFGLCADCR
jgi:Fe2+ or Zn2+ uptake regulation protein